MPKIQDVGIGNYIRNPKGRRAEDSRGMSVEVLRVAENHGNSFLCFPVINSLTVPVTVDTKRYEFIPLDTNVEEVTI